MIHVKILHIAINRRYNFTSLALHDALGQYVSENIKDILQKLISIQNFEESSVCAMVLFRRRHTGGTMTSIQGTVKTDKIKLKHHVS